MENEFRDWMEYTDKRKPGVAINYSTAINQISQHYTTETGRRTDIYKIRDKQLLIEIRGEYNKGGRFENIGDERHGLYRAAINKYVCFFEAIRGSNNSGFNEETNFSVSDGKISVKKNSTGRITVNISLIMEEAKK